MRTLSIAGCPLAWDETLRVSALMPKDERQRWAAHRGRQLADYRRRRSPLIAGTRSALRVTEWAAMLRRVT